MKLHPWLLGTLFIPFALWGYNEGAPETVAWRGVRLEEEGLVKPVAAELSARQPHWRPRVVSLFPDGSAEKAIYYEMSEGGREQPVKEVHYFASGQLKLEGDLTEVAGEPVPHGVRVSYYVNGVPEQIAFYDQGKLHGPLQLFYSHGQLKRLEMMEGGVRNGKYETFDEDGSKREVAQYVDGKVVGDWLSFHPNGVKAASVPYGPAGLPNGVATEWYESGSVKSTKRYSNGLLCGDGWNPAVTLYYENQAIAELQDFRDGKPLGQHYQYFEDGREAYKATYRDGKKHGAELWFFEDGAKRGYGEWRDGTPIGKHWMNHRPDQLASMAEYDGQGRLLKPIVEFYENGVKSAEYLLVNGQLEGECRHWFDNGQLKLLYNYHQGEYSGEQSEYDLAGQLRVRSHFVNGVRHGLHEEWHDKGQLAARCHWVEGQKEGDCLRWYANGRQSELESYKGGVLDGKCASWWEDGRPKFEVTYKEGERDGWCREWSEAGVLVMEANYSQGRPASDFKQWHENGQLAALVPIVAGMREGKEERFYPNGSRFGVASFHNDQLDGELLTWFEDGLPCRVQQFAEGLPVGTHKEYLPVRNREGQPQLARLTRFADGKLDGEQRSYHKSGLVQAVVNYKDGVLHGMKALWDEEGSLVEEGWYEMGDLQGRFYHRDADGREVVFHYKDNQREGLHQVFYPRKEGEPAMKEFEVLYVHGKPEGEFSEYSKTGAKLASTFYHQGKKSGTSSLFSEEGKLLMTMEFVDDLNHGPMVQYFPNGRVLKRVNFVQGEKDGEEVAYYLDGQVASSYPYQMGRLHGVAREWNDQGKLVFEAEYSHGTREGRFNKYYDDGKPQVLQNFCNDKLHGVKKIYNPQGQVTEVRYDHGKRVYGNATAAPSRGAGG